MFDTLIADGGNFLRWDSLGLSPVALDLGFFQIRWYALSYIGGIMLGWWYISRLLAQPGAPMAARHVEDLAFYGTLGILLGGRLAYTIFYMPSLWENPIQVLQLWHGGMSFHGGAFGMMLAMMWVAWRNKLNVLRVHDYVSCVVPIGLFLGRIANFINGELWGRQTTVPWAIIFPGDYAGDVPRHPSQLYEAGLEGIVLFTVLSLLFWKTKARYYPGLLVGVFMLGYGLSRFIIEFVREPDAGLGTLSWGLTMGQTLTVPMAVVGIYLIITAKGRRQRVEPFAEPTVLPDTLILHMPV